MRASIRQLLALALLCSPAGAQDGSGPAATFDSLVARWRDAQERLRAFDDSVAAARLTMDTLRHGPFRILTSDSRELAVAAARVALDSLGPLGDSALAPIRQGVFVIRREPVPTWSRKRIRPVIVVVLDSNGTEHARLWEQSEDPRVIGLLVMSHARDLLAGHLNPALARWLRPGQGLPALRFDALSDQEWRDQRLHIVGSANPLGQSCHGGDMDACRALLSLRMLPAPYFEAQRMALLRLALEKGGERSIPLLYSGAGPPAEQLERISGVPVDTLVREWHARLRNRRPPSDNMTPGMAFTSVVWVALLGMLATRSRRWR